MYSSVPIVQPVNRSVELIVRANSHHQVLIGAKLNRTNWIHGEVRFARGGVEAALFRSDRRIETIRGARAFIEIFKSRDHSLRPIPNPRVVAETLPPAPAPSPHRRP